MFGNIFGACLNNKAQMDAMAAARLAAEMRAMQEQQMVLHKAMTVAGAKMVIMKPDGTIVPIYD